MTTRRAAHELVDEGDQASVAVEIAENGQTFVRIGVDLFGEIRRLRSAFASEIYFAFLEEPLLVPQRHARSLALNFQCDFTEACADETHDNDATWIKSGIKLKSCVKSWQRSCIEG